MTSIDDIINQLNEHKVYDQSQEVALDQCSTKVSNLTTERDDALADNAALASQLEAANAEIAALKAAQPPPPLPTTGLIGATCGSTDGGLSRKNADGSWSGVMPAIRRCYDLSGSGAKEAVARVLTGGVVWGNYKLVQFGGSISDATLRAELQAFASLISAKKAHGLITFEHEPDIKGGVPGGVAAYKAGYDQLERIIVEFPTLEPIVCMTGFTGDKNFSVWETYWRPTHKKIGFDHYNKGHQTQGESFSTPQENYGNMVTWAKSKGKPMAIAETGVGTDAVPGAVIKTRADWYKAHRAYVLDPANNIFAANAFDSGLAELDASSAHAWFGV